MRRATVHRLERCLTDLRDEYASYARDLNYESDPETAARISGQQNVYSRVADDLTELLLDLAES